MISEIIMVIHTGVLAVVILIRLEVIESKVKEAIEIFRKGYNNLPDEQIEAIQEGE